MTLAETVAFIWSSLVSLLPFLNTGILTLIVNLLFERAGWKIRKRELREDPLKSLILGLCLISISGLISLIIQTWLSGLAPFGVLVFLFVGYLALTQI